MKTQLEKLKLFGEPIKVPELGIWIIPKQLFNGKIYPEILNEVSEDLILTYDFAQKLRNIAFDSGWKKYPFMKNFWVFIPNPDKASKSNGYVAGFIADSEWADLNCVRVPSGWDSDLGVFLYCPIAA